MADCENSEECLEESEAFSTTEKEESYVKKNRSKYQEFFEPLLAKSKKEKKSGCLLCGKNRKGEFISIVQTTNGNTSGIRSHLKSQHPKEFETKFGAQTTQKSKSLDNQSSLDLTFRQPVNIIRTIYFTGRFYQKHFPRASNTRNATYKSGVLSCFS